jgi:hypothetical protein
VVTYMCVISSQESEWSCICVLYQARKVSSHVYVLGVMYMCVSGHVYVLGVMYMCVWSNVVYVLVVMYMCVRGHVCVLVMYMC